MSVDAIPVAVSEEAADLGCVFVSCADGDHRLSEARAWREEGVYTVRSTEFDVIAEDEDFDRAIDVFVAWLIGYAALLAERVDAGKATEDEACTFAVLSARLFPLPREAEQEQRRQLSGRSTRNGYSAFSMPPTGSAPCVLKLCIDANRPSGLRRCFL